MKYERKALEPLAKSSDGWCLSYLNKTVYTKCKWTPRETQFYGR